MNHRWLRHFHPFRDLETNPQTQLSVHKWGQRYWIGMIPVVLGLYYFFPKEWVASSLLLNTLWTLYSNWSTDNGAAASAKAVLNTLPNNTEILAAIEQTIEI
jgi:hypothetical protein